MCSVGERERDIRDREMFSSVGLWEGFLGVKGARLERLLGPMKCPMHPKTQAARQGLCKGMAV